MSRMSRQQRLAAGALVLVLVVIALGTAYALASPRGGPRERLLAEVERELARLQTVQGRLSISLQTVTLEQELWAQRPRLFRTETARGPGGFQGTIVVLNDQEGWVYTPALAMATVVDRAQDPSDVTGDDGVGSLLERMPDSVLALLRNPTVMHAAPGEPVAGRSTTLLELVVGPGEPSFPEGPLQVWLDDQYSYPLAWRDSTGRTVRFSSIVFNQAIDPLTFSFYPPPGATVHRVQPEP